MQIVAVVLIALLMMGYGEMAVVVVGLVLALDLFFSAKSA